MAGRSDRLKAGDRVVKDEAAWSASELDGWGRGEGVGVVMPWPFVGDDPDGVDVRWPAGRCLEAVAGLRRVIAERE